MLAFVIDFLGFLISAEYKGLEWIRWIYILEGTGMNAESNGTNPTNAIRFWTSQCCIIQLKTEGFWPTATTSVREGVHGHLAHRKFHMFPKKKTESQQIFIISGDISPKSRTSGIGLTLICQWPRRTEGIDTSMKHFTVGRAEKTVSVREAELEPLGFASRTQKWEQNSTETSLCVCVCVCVCCA